MDNLPPTPSPWTPQSQPVPVDNNGNLDFPQPTHPSHHVASPIHIQEETKYSDKNDPPLVDVKVTNPITYLKKWLKSILKNEGIDIRLKIRPLTVFAIVTALSVSFGTGFNIARMFFPNSSPILHRAVTFQGTLKKSASGQYTLSLPDSSIWTLKPTFKTNQNTENLLDQQVMVKGNLGTESYVLETSEIIPLTNQVALPSPSPIDSDITTPNVELPKLYSAFQWDIVQKRTLIFTSGKRKITLEGVYLESIDIKDYPQDFINYYTQTLQGYGFKQTLDSTTPDGKTFSYEKDGLYLTFGVKNVYSGTGDKRQLTDYRAFIEHN